MEFYDILFSSGEASPKRATNVNEDRRRVPSIGDSNLERKEGLH